VSSLCEKSAYTFQRQTATFANGDLKVLQDIGESFRPILCRRERELRRILFQLVDILTNVKLDRWSIVVYRWNNIPPRRKSEPLERLYL